VDIDQIAESLAVVLAPALPELVQPGAEGEEPAAGDNGQAAGASEEVRELWSRVRQPVESRAEAVRALAAAARAPEAGPARVEWQRHLREILAADLVLAEEIASRLAGKPVAAALGRQAVAVVDGIGAGRDVNLHLHNQGPEGLGPDEGILWQAYLGRLIEQTEIVPLSVVDREVADSREDLRLKLPSVYTALLTLSARFEPGKDREPRREEEARSSALEQVDRHRKLVLLGDPGSGKSTFVSFLALCLAGERLGRADANLSLLTAPLPQDDGKEKPQPWSRGRLLPVRVVLRDFAAKGLLGEPGEPATARWLWKFLQGELEEAGHAEFFPALKREILAGRALVLLDGLDEVPETDDRRRQIRQVVAEFATGVGESRVLVTGRTYAYQDPGARLPGFEVAVLAPFSRAQIGRFVGLWYDHQVALGRMPEPQAQGRGELLRRAIFASDRLLSLAERPLLLTLMASLHALRGGDLPERREQLYEESVELLLNVWEKQRARRDRKGQLVMAEPSLAAWLEVDRDEVRKALEELAFEAHRGQTELEGTADVPGWRLAERLLDLRGEAGIEKAGKVDAMKLLSHLENRCGLLLARGRGMYTFPHRTFQEYLAACYLTGADTFPDEVAKLGREDPDRWREVVLLVGAKMGRGAVWYLADALCDRLVDDEDTGPEDEWGALLAGQAVAESADLSRVGRLNEAKLARLRDWLAHLLRLKSFPARERAAAGKALAKLEDPRFDKERWYLPREPLLGFVEVAEGAFWMGSDKEKDPQAWDDELPQHEICLPRYWIGRFPVTVGQYRAFVETTAGTVEDRRSVEGPANHPVVAVSWGEAMAYCRWLGDRLRKEALERQRRGECGALWSELAGGRLRCLMPSEAEWEKAARGSDGRIYPWGSEADANRANYGDAKLGETSSVGCFPFGASVFGCEEMSGNVWEWTRSGDEPYPYEAEDGREDLEVSAQSLRVLRGGAFYDAPRGTSVVPTASGTARPTGTTA
jgi:formylglycine-generating enzyme required for sulfatase activity